ncbi:restriction endonuclease subunit S [Flavobacterium sp. ANB]|uniref:restriction endonuclease subunit S n=1 Tax=unclassified Flavobacterium TaxID=196869 RepID=UPI0012B7D624|nr:MULTISPECIES: restriction endonuclease subunit S [unclassified Flavobacterium]MBF4517835.1 restriction endonuclease subunit S [Flavobacterium sp. ANB]MTD72095.1 N-6 DNA methylase [Flavobacterium sp. LC2016-13]
MDNKKLILSLGFTPKENTVGIFQKKYSNLNNYTIEIDFEKEIINFGNKIKGESKTTQNFSQAENWVVVECVNRLLDKGYQPQNITLEKTWKTGHGTSGRLDILISKEDNSAYLMIECKTWGTEFEKELKNLEKNGGQLFTYFQQDKNADVLMLYASKLDGKKVEYKNTIVKIEEDYRQAGNVKDFFERWNKLPKTNGVFDTWVSPYEFQSKALTKNDLKVLRQEDSSFIFNRFLEILRHNVVSDKPNAFNKIFTLFLCKIVDENRNASDQLHFQWLEGEDDHVSFQKRLTDLYNRGMLELLEKKVTDVSDSEFDKQFLQVESQYKDKFKEILTEIRLKKNNEFAIKEVYDDASFEENAKVVKEVVELLQVYQIRYNYRQQFLSDFFELLLTTGLKQESGQFFTPVPIARFIIKSLPFQEITTQKIEVGNKNDLLPTIIDYAAGSGHFITESMEVVQKHIDILDESKFNPTTQRAIKKWKEDQFDWAESYVYGIEKDYRLVKTAKVSCYLHGDGLAKVIHGDGLGDFGTSTEFKDLLKETDKSYPQDNKQFDVIISNPPYSVSAFKGLMDEEKSKLAFDLYSRLTDQSSEIECLFIERTKQLLKDGGVAGIILPSSILSNTGIYTQTREILLKYFEILGIAELGSNTFMATGTNTVTLFLRRRNNADSYNVEEAIKKCFVNLQDITINGIEKPLNKYVAHVWGTISFDDYKTLLQKSPNKNIVQHEIYKEYIKKIKAKDKEGLWNNILTIEQDKLLYFILAYPQKLVLVKTGEKNEEKRFLGYEFSNRRGSEGIHAIQRSKSIDDCTQLYDAESFTNPDKASTYIYKAFLGEFDLDISENLQQNLSYHNLVDMFTFDRVDFEKNISLSAKKKVKFDDVWNTSDLVFLSEITDIQKGRTITEAKTVKGNVPVIAGGQSPAYFHNESNRDGNIITVSASGAYAGFVNYFETPIFASDCNTIKSKDEKIISTKLIFNFLKSIQMEVYKLQRGQAQPHVYADDLSKIKIPLPPISIQKKIVAEIEVLEMQKHKVVDEVENLRTEIQSNFKNIRGQLKRLDEVCDLKAGNFVKVGDIDKTFSSELYPCYGGNGLRGYTKTYTNDGKFSLVGRQGALCGNVHLVSGKFHATEHALVAYPKEGVDLIWLHYQLVFMNLNQHATGTAQPGLSVMNLNPIEIPLPTIEEQKKIVLEIEDIESKILVLEKQIADIPKKREVILKKYLQ